MDLVFIGLTKAFDAVNGEALWVILSKLECPTKFVNLIRQFRDDMTGQVLADGEASEPSASPTASSTGVCCLSSSSTCVLNHAVRDLEQGVYLRYQAVRHSPVNNQDKEYDKDCSGSTKHYLLTNVPSWSIENLTFESSLTSLQKPPASSVSPSAWARQRSCFNQHLPLLPTDSQSQLMTPS